MPFILGTNSIKDTGYDVANSCRFNSGSSDRLNRTQTAGNRRTYTISWWLKRSGLSASTSIIGSDPDGSHGNHFTIIDFNSSDNLDLSEYSSGHTFRLITNRKFRDVSAWMNIVFAVDTTQATASNRLKLYINGVQETSFSTENYPSQDLETRFNLNSNIFTIGGRSGQYLNGYFAEVVTIDGTALDATSFGEFDEDSPTIWKPIDVSGLTFGTNGFYLDFEDSSALGNDVSGNNNDFTVNNLTAVDQSSDSCTNNFATLNPLQVQIGTANEPVFREGNLQIHGSSTGAIKFYAPSTIGVSSGKWYAEFKSTISSNVFGMVGVDSNPGELARNDQYPGYYANSYGYYKDGNKYTADSASSYGNSWTNNTIGVALDLDNNKLYFSKDGTFQNSGDPTSGSTGTGAISITAPSSTTAGAYFFVLGDGSTSYINPFDCNFGSPIHSISSGNADGNGYGNFEYAVPSGYYSLNTKNLAEFG